ncbi:MAG: ATP-binding protein [Oscillospiraceae bacterium]|nr:ATP-binding protein [Oscillospiraceae bacterium]
MNEQIIVKQTQYARLKVDIDDNFRIVSADERFTDITGFKHSDIVTGLYMSRMIPTEAYNDYITSIRDNITKNGEFLCEHPIIIKNRTVITVSCFGEIELYDSVNTRKVKMVMTVRRNDVSEESRDHLGPESDGKDKLTGLFSRESGEKLIKQYLKIKPKAELCALCIIDVDSFFEVNNLYGREFGNSILEEVAQKLSAIVRPTDIVVRLGGDEFMVFTKNTNKSYIKTFGTSISQRVNSIYAGQEKDISISCTIGIVNTFYSEKYEQLFNFAYKTLMFAKKTKKGSSLLYSEVSHLVDSKALDDTLLDKGVDTIMDLSPNYNKSIISFAFSLLEKSRDLKSAINLLLPKIARTFNFSRIIIFEINDDSMFYKFTYHWCEKGKPIDFNKLYDFNRRDYNVLLDNFENDGIFQLTPKISSKLSKPLRKLFDKNDKNQYIFSAIYNEGIFKGSLIFETHEKNRKLLADEAATLKELSRIISTHISMVNADLASKAKSEFLSRMSHEIRTPINAIKGMTDRALYVIENDERFENDEVYGCLDKIRISTRYLISLVNDILDMSKIESGKMSIINEAFDMNNLIEEFELLIRPQAEQRCINFTIIRNYASNMLMGDQLRINQVLINLASNALKFTPFSGTISVLIDEIQTTDEYAKLKFSVEDNGIGIRPQNLKRIFESFEQAEPNITKSFGGTGLGLAISRNLVELMGGKLDVESEENKGAKFFFTVNFKKCDNMKENLRQISQSKSVNIDFTGKKLLLVEDNDFNAEFSKALLESAGFEVELAMNGKQAVYTFTVNPSGTYDAILMDIRMPLMNGYEAVKCIRSSGKDDAHCVPIIALTANASDDDERQAMESGMNGYLSKPFDKEMLFRVLNQFLKCTDSSQNEFIMNRSGINI